MQRKQVVRHAIKNVVAAVVQQHLATVALMDHGITAVVLQAAAVHLRRVVPTVQPAVM